MNDRATNQLNMIGTCVGLAQQTAHAAVWTGQPPLDFGTDFAKLKTDYTATNAAAATAYAATTGSADAKATAETALENAAYVLARACASHFKKTGDLTHRAQVDFSKTDIVRLRDQTLANTAKLIRDLAYAVRNEPDAAKRGITTDRINTLNGARDAYTELLTAPRVSITHRSALIREVETLVADLVAQLDDLDDLVVQFDGTPAGRTFITAWKQARIIVDAGHGPGEAPAPTPGGGTPPPSA